MDEMMVPKFSAAYAVCALALLTPRSFSIDVAMRGYTSKSIPCVSDVKKPKTRMKSW